MNQRDILCIYYVYNTVYIYIYLDSLGINLGSAKGNSTSSWVHISHVKNMQPSNCQLQNPRLDSFQSSQRREGKVHHTHELQGGEKSIEKSKYISSSNNHPFPIRTQNQEYITLSFRTVSPRPLHFCLNVLSKS